MSRRNLPPGRSPPTSGPNGVVTGPDGAVWFTEGNANKIGRITVDGRITECDEPTPAATPHGIVAGPDGHLWFTEVDGDGNKIGRVCPDQPCQR